MASIFPNVFELNSVIIYVSTGEIAACPLLCPLLCHHLPFAGALWAAVFLVGRLLPRAREALAVTPAAFVFLVAWEIRDRVQRQ